MPREERYGTSIVNMVLTGTPPKRLKASSGKVFEVGSREKHVKDLHWLGLLALTAQWRLGNRLIS